MADAKTQKIPDSRPILIPQDKQLYSLLDQLGVRRKNAAGDAEGRYVITKRACDKVGVPFEFIQAFAGLSKGVKDPQYTAVAKLFRKKPDTVGIQVEKEYNDLLGYGLRLRKAPFTWDLKHYKFSPLPQFKPKPLGKGSSKQKSEFYDAMIELMTRYAVKKAAQLFETHSPAEQVKADRELDPEETRALMSVLRVLDKKDSSQTAQNKQAGRLQNVRLVRKRIKALSDQPCWLGAEAMRIGLFGTINGELTHRLATKSILRKTTQAHEFQCPYLPEMDPITTGLSYRTEQMPAPVQKAAASTVRLETLSGGGSGVVIQPNYILTARHVVDKGAYGRRTYVGQRSRPERISLTVIVDGKEIKTVATILDVPGKKYDRNPDLAVLYIPDLPASVKPLAFSANVKAKPLPTKRATKGSSPDAALQKLREKHPELYLELLLKLEMRGETELVDKLVKSTKNPNIRFRYTDKDVYLIGSPHQTAPYDLLVTPGLINAKRTKVDPTGRMTVTAPTIPGNSGGPAVDSKGRIVGIVTELTKKDDVKSKGLHYTRGLYSSRFGEVRTAVIDGGKMYPMAEWGSDIKKVIKTHQASLKAGNNSLAKPDKVQDLDQLKFLLRDLESPKDFRYKRLPGGGMNQLRWGT